MNKLRNILLFIIILLASFQLFAQRVDPADAEEHFKHHNFIDALSVYEKLIEKDPKNPDYPFKAGYCILHINSDKSKAIKHLEIASERKSDPDVDFYLAKAYHVNMKLDNALATMKKYKTSGIGTKQ
ncbi:MAG: hypothetical protein COY57_03765, partial [Flavobacteriales bacterium CG_4_10_14_0_8_um_filter_32_5]